MYDCVIIGSGPAGLTSALYLARANKKVLVIVGNKGGQLTTTSHIENYPGFVKPVLGTQLMNDFYDQAKEYGAEFLEDMAIEFDSKTDYFLTETYTEKIQSKSIIVATGSSPKLLGLEDKYFGRGISTCATCDGHFYKNKIVAVIGGGNSALEESLYLSNLASKVYIIHRRDEFRGEDILKKRVFEKKNIEIIWDSKVEQFLGATNLSGIEVVNVKTQEKTEIKIEGAFIAIGHVPNNVLLKDKVVLDENGYVKNSVSTEVKGLFVAGDLHDYKYRQAITAAGFGCMAAFEVLHYLNNIE